MKKLILLCLVFVFSNTFYAQDKKTKAKKTKATAEKVVKEKKEKAAKVKEKATEAKEGAKKEVQKVEKETKSKTKAVKDKVDSSQKEAKEKLLTEEEKNATLSRLTTTTDLASGVAHAELVVEAATENVDLKLKIFKDMDANAPAHCILATNTSSISITKIAAVTSRPDKVIGMHFMNPVPVMKLVEVIRGYNTTDEVTKMIFDLSVSLQKVPVEVNDYPGFVANRILMPMINEAIGSLH